MYTTFCVYNFYFYRTGFHFYEINAIYSILYDCLHSKPMIAHMVRFYILTICLHYYKSFSRNYAMRVAFPNSQRAVAVAHYALASPIKTHPAFIISSALKFDCFVCVVGNHLAGDGPSHAAAAAIVGHQCCHSYSKCWIRWVRRPQYIKGGTMHNDSNFIEEVCESDTPTDRLPVQIPRLHGAGWTNRCPVR